MKSLLLVILFLVLAIVVAGAIALGVMNLGVDRTAVRSQTISAGVREIVVKPGAGDVELIPADTFIRVRETQHFIIEKPKLENTRVNGVLTIETRCDDLPEVVPCYSDLRIAVPPDVQVTVDGESGDVDLRAIDVRGAHVETGSGDIEMGLVGRLGLLWAHSDSGDIDVVAAGAGAVDVQSDSGEVTVDVAAKPRSVRARTETGDVELALQRGIYAIRSKTETGDADVRLLRNASSQSAINARSLSGDITLRPR